MSNIFINFYYVLFLKKKENNINKEITEKELNTVVHEANTQGSINEQEAQLFKNLLTFGQVNIKKIMRPRNEIFAIDIQENLCEALEKICEKKYSRIPVIDKKIDNITGILYTKDLLSNKTNVKIINDLEKIIHPVYFIPLNMKADKLFTEFKNRKLHMAIVIDEYGGVSGLITMEDLLEEIMGEIVDKDDIIPLYRIFNEQMIEVKGKIEINELNKIFKLDLHDPHAVTVGGYILNRIGRIPKPGETIIINKISFKITDTLPNKIEEILITKLPSLKTQKNIKNRKSKRKKQI